MPFGGLECTEIAFQITSIIMQPPSFINIDANNLMLTNE